MATARIAITVDRTTLAKVDRSVKDGRFPRRSRAVQFAPAEMLAPQKRRRLVKQLRKLDRAEERALAEEPFGGEAPSPERSPY
jgi:Arc/MetJ-type ribon-helix-helix transcriptional regulator